jgi:hypothetical protein
MTKQAIIQRRWQRRFRAAAIHSANIQVCGSNAQKIMAQVEWSNAG